ncbi:MAG: hypothetical protein KKE61_18220 [Proteobacteria bacterium]|nr:hypothetical protein [Pseudomonadota bacterium]
MPKKETTKRSRVKPSVKADQNKETPPNQFPVIGIGASAGGLEALQPFFSTVSEKSGMAYIVVVHMMAKQPSLMPELLQKIASIPVLQATDGQIVKPDHVYIIPPNKELNIFKGQIVLLPMANKQPFLPINSFFSSLAIDQKENAAGIVLSGTGTDGSLGIKDIKTHNGLVMVQSETSSKYNGMPRSAVKTGVTDVILPPEKMYEWLVQYFLVNKIKPDEKKGLSKEDPNWLNKIFNILRAKIGHDFSNYKTNTLLRRVTRRMELNLVDNPGAYLKLLQESPKEADDLFGELLIGVTSFFF